MLQSPVCPSCGTTMTAGSLGTMSYVAGVTWHKSRSALALGGEKIAGSSLGGMVWMDGFRCPGCRLLLLQY
jgi:Domain of unknown function (DUF6487)